MPTRARKPIPQPKVQKTIFQARYKPRLQFFDLLLPAAEHFTTYLDWETDRLELRLYSFERHCSLNLRSDSFTYEREWWGDANSLHDIEEALDVLPVALQLSPYTRLGLRRIFLVTVEMAFTELVQLFDLKLFSQEPALRQSLPRKLDDLSYRMDLSDDDFKYHLMVAPITQRECTQVISVNAKYHLAPAERDRLLLETLTHYPPVGIFFDVDIYTENDASTSETDRSFLTHAHTRMEQLVTDLRNVLLGRS